MAKQYQVPYKDILNNVKGMVNNYETQKIVKSVGLTIENVTWEDNARNKNSVYGPCISDMTLQCENEKMPVIRYSNYQDITWDILIEKIPLLIGNELQNNNNNNKNNLKSINLKEYLSNFEKYITNKPENNNKKINLLTQNKNSKIKDTHVIMSSQACFLPIEYGKQTKFNVALFNYQSQKYKPAVLVIIATSKGTSAQVIEGNEQKLLFNNNGIKADFIGQRLIDNRKERKVKLTGAMTAEEKANNCIMIIQIPLKQSLSEFAASFYNSNNNNNNIDLLDDVFGGAPAIAKGLGGYNKQENDWNDFAGDDCDSDDMEESDGDWGDMQFDKSAKKKKSKKKEADVEPAMVKIGARTEPVCVCNKDLFLKQAKYCYNGNGLSCDACKKQCYGDDQVWHCDKENSYVHENGYDLCFQCGTNQLKFNELGNCDFDVLKRDERYPIRVTLQYYKSTTNGVINKDILQAIKSLLDKSKQDADWIGSLVTEKSLRPTEPELKEDIFNININNSLNKTKNILQKIGGNNWKTWIKNFETHEVYDEDIFYLDDDMLKELIPKIGPRSRFKQCINKLRKNNNDNDLSNMFGNILDLK